MLASNNILSEHGDRRSCQPGRRAGLYYATREKINGRTRRVLRRRRRGACAYENKEVELQTRITCGSASSTSTCATGEKADADPLRDDRRPRAAVGDPARRPAVSVLNRPLKKKEISRLIKHRVPRCGLRETVIFADKLLQSGFALATRPAVDRHRRHVIPQQKAEIIRSGRARGEGDRGAVHLGLVTQGERYNKVSDIWGRAGDQVGKV